MTSDRSVICTQSTKDRRHVKASVHREAFTEYGIVDPQSGAYEVDHLIPLALGGDNTIANLWAEPAEPRPGFHEKDSVEDYLHQEVCAGAMDLVDAQRAIAIDWVAIYRQLQGPLLAPREDREGD